MERRLAAILAADMVGYSQLMEADEMGTLAQLKTHRKELIDPKIAEHRGRIVKLIGDGMLVEFASVVDSVACAVEVQRAMEKRNADVPKDRQITFRVGINLGDIIVDGDDIYGDGVNIAARLEALCEPGDIHISGTAYDHLKRKIDVGFEYLGERQVKNIAEPVRVYSLSIDGTSGADKAPSGEPPSFSDNPSIAVLPFTNLSGDAEQDYFANGVTDDLITALSKIRWFFVIARNSTFTYKGQAVEVKQVAQELGVRYVLEGSVRTAGNRVRISAQLVDATTGRHVWAESYDREVEDIFALQDEMTQTIVGAVEPELGAFERERARHKPPESLDAWESYQRGLWHMWGFTADNVVEARRLLCRARELDQGFAAACASEAYTHFLDVILGYTDTPDQALAAALEGAKKAVALDDKDPFPYFTLGRVYMMRGKHDASIAELEMALWLNPSFAQAYFGLGFALALSGRLEEAAEALDTSVRLSPRDSLTCILLHQYETAAEYGRKAIREPRASGYWPYAVLASALGNLGRIEDARTAVDAALEQKPDLTRAYLEKTLPTKKRGGLERYLVGLKKAGLPA